MLYLTYGSAKRGGARMADNEKVIKISKQVSNGSEIEIILKIKRTEEENLASYKDVEKDIMDVFSGLALSLLREIYGDKLTN